MADRIGLDLTTIERVIVHGQTSEDYEKIMNDLRNEIIRLQSSDSNLLPPFVNAVTKIVSKSYFGLEEFLKNFFIEYLMKLLKIWREKSTFENVDDSETFKNLGIILNGRSALAPNDALKQELAECLSAIVNRGQEMFKSPHISTITLILRNFCFMETNYYSSFMEVSILDEPVIKCFCCSYTIDIFSEFLTKVDNDLPSDSHQFVLYGLLDYLARLHRQQLGRFASALRQHFLPSISQMLDTFLVSYENWSENSLTIATTLTTTFLYTVQVAISDDIHYDFQIRIIDTSIKILLKKTPHTKISIDCLQNIYIATFHDRLVDYLKSSNLVETIFMLIQLYKEEAEMQFNAYRILAAIMTEEDIKRLEDPGVIADVFLKQLKTVKDIQGWEVRMRNILNTLKILLQHDQIRDEVYKQGGIQLFLDCAKEARFDAIIHQRSLENLLIMAFHKGVFNELKGNSELMELLRSYSSNETEPDLQRAAESLLWVLTKEESTKSSTNKKQYDIMISYSHKDKELCFKLYDRLLENKFRVWLDRDQIHGTPLEAMSNAIENSEFVFLCMSDAYKQSGYCKMEAYYALESQCKIIPLVMKPKYKPDGWLGIISTGRMRIDFPKYGFEEAYKNLLVEIQRNREGNEEKSNVGHHQRPTFETKSVTSPKQEKKIMKTMLPIEKKDHILPVNIEQWTNEDVQQFLVQKHLESFFPICETMNGKRLFSMVRMCLSNPPVMLQSLNQEITYKHGGENPRLIEITEFLQFLEDIKEFVTISFEQQNPNAFPQSAVCVLM